VQSIQLYIEGQRVDMYKDESVQLTQSIQNVKDIAKVFTEFTKTFTLPASKTNNKIFKHYYNFDIVDGFDARTKKDATLELNYLPFKKGKIKLEGVDLQNRRPKSYRITFFGNTVELKDLLGEDKLDALDWLNNFTLDYDASNVKTRLQSGADFTINSVTYTDAIITPLIAHNYRLYYDSSTHVQDTRNLAFSGSGQKNGVLWSDLKYAIRVYPIIKAIEEKYGLTFSTDFFNTSNSRFYDMYLWLQRKKGNLIEDDQEFISQVTAFALTPTGDYVITTSLTELEVQILITDITLTTVASTSTVPYDVLMYRNGVLVGDIIGKTGNLTNEPINFTNFSDGTLTFYVRAKDAIDLTTFSLTFSSSFGSGAPSPQTVGAGNAAVTTTISFIPTQQVPEIKVIDFLTGLFKLFNLTTFVENDGTIYVDTLDNFYANKKSISTAYDISEFVDVNSSTVDVALPYKEISFKFKGTKSLLASKFNQINNREWGSIDYNNNENLDGGVYKVEAPFEHMQFERLSDGVGGTTVNLQVGYMIDENEDPIKGEPLLFYPIYNDTNEKSIAFLTDLGVNHIKIPESSYTGYYIPSNSISLDDTTDDTVLHFGLEINEWKPSGNFDGTLFEDLYKSYIQNVFNTKNRLTKVKAYLPLRILLNFTLADRFDINGKRYKINSIDTNLATGESSIELLNEL
jgi:hypothetical protein